MGKTHRGKGLKDQVRNGRGVCPICKRMAVKVVYETQVEGKTIKVCKTCKATLSHRAAAPKAAEATAPAPAPAT